MISVKSINKKKEFDLLYKKGKALNGDLFYLKYLNAKNPEEATRISIIIGTKVSKKAVERNGKKRQLKEIVRAEGEKIKSGYWVLIIAKENLIKSDFQDLKKEFEDLFKKAKLL